VDQPYQDGQGDPEHRPDEERRERQDRRSAGNDGGEATAPAGQPARALSERRNPRHFRHFASPPSGAQRRGPGGRGQAAGPTSGDAGRWTLGFLMRRRSASSTSKAKPDGCGISSPRTGTLPARVEISPPTVSISDASIGSSNFNPRYSSSSCTGVRASV